MPFQGRFNDKYPNENYHSFEFFKFHAFKGYTSINYPLLFYGQNKKVKKKYLSKIVLLFISTKFFKKLFCKVSLFFCLIQS